MACTYRSAELLLPGDEDCYASCYRVARRIRKLAQGTAHYDCTSLVDAVGNLLAPHEGMRLVQAAVAWPNAERCLEVLWVPSYCDLQGNELADEEAKLGLAKHQPPVRLDCANRRAVI